jgi:hypothetical protein
MRKFILACLLGMAAWLSLSASSQALVLCTCCAEQQDRQRQCTAICDKAAPEPGHCAPVVNYSPAKQRPKTNPLYGESLMEISLGRPNPQQLESWRRFLERYRRRAFRDYDKTAEKYRRGRLDDAELAAAKALRDKAMVNYNHGIRAYDVAVGRKPE